MQKVLSTIKNYAVSVIAPALMIVILLLVSPETRSMDAVVSLLRQGFAPAVLGWGVLFNRRSETGTSRSVRVSCSPASLPDGSRSGSKT